MRIISLFFFMILLSCTSIKKEYVCGDRPCVDKREFNEYFSENLIVEIKSQSKKKKKEPNLIKLNTSSLDLENKTKTISKKEKKLIQKNEKKLLKANKKKLLEERKINKDEKKRDEKKIANVTVSKDNTKNKPSFIKKFSLRKNKKKDNLNKEIFDKAINTKKVKNICKEIKDCDIEEIADILIKKGKNKPFPDIASK